MAFGSRIDCASCCCGSGVAAGAPAAAPRAGNAGAPMAAFATASPPKAGAAPRAGAGAVAAGAAPPAPRPPPPPPPRGGAEIALKSGPNREPLPLTRWQLRQFALLLSKTVLPRTASPGGSEISGAVCANNSELNVQTAARISEGTVNVLILFAAFMEGVRILARHGKDKNNPSDHSDLPPPYGYGGPVSASMRRRVASRPFQKIRMASRAWTAPVIHLAESKSELRKVFSSSCSTLAT